MSLDPEALAKLAQLSSSGRVSTDGSPGAHTDESPDNTSSEMSDSEHSGDTTLSDGADAGGSHTAGSAESGASDSIIEKVSGGVDGATITTFSSQNTQVSAVTVGDVRNIVVDQLGEYLDVSTDAIDDSALLLRDESADDSSTQCLDLGELGLWSVVTAVEQDLQLTLPDDKVATAHSVGDLIAICEKAMNR